MSRYIKRFGDPKEKTRPRVSHYTGRRMQAEEFLCTPDKIFLFVIFPAMHVGMERSKHQDMNGIVALLLLILRVQQHTLKSNVGFLFGTGVKGDGISCVSSMYAFCKY